MLVNGVKLITFKFEFEECGKDERRGWGVATKHLNIERHELTMALERIGALCNKT